MVSPIVKLDPLDYNPGRIQAEAEFRISHTSPQDSGEGSDQSVVDKATRADWHLPDSRIFLENTFFGQLKCQGVNLEIKANFGSGPS